MKRVFLALCATAICCGAYSQDVVRERPAEWEGIVEGGRFQDRFLPMVEGQLSSDVWGAEAVIPRYVDNGIEDDTFSYWGGNIIKDGDKYKLFVCGWLENSHRGHQTWSRSIIFRTEADNLQGPYTNMEVVGFGHNPELYRAKNGEYVIAASIQWKPHYYISNELDGVWKLEPFAFDTRDRGVIEEMSNLSFTSREDGSVVMVCRGGGIWISQDGISPFQQISTESVYPKREGRFEDPVIWRDNIQYHLIVNDWLGRVAYYLRSLDGVNWVEDAGEAYTPGIAYHKDGHVEDWYKFERIKIFQDEHRRAIQANFAVCDTLKNEDLGNDRHSSKNIAIPLNKGVLMEIVEDKITPKIREISLLVRAEDGFNPQTDLEIESLRFGLSSDINYGKGCPVKSTEKVGKDLKITFKTSGYIIPDSEFAPKMMGRYNNGEVVYGYARNPNVDFQPAILSCRKPTQNGDKIEIVVENFGLKSSTPSQLIMKLGDQTIITTNIPTLEPYASTSLPVGTATLTKGTSCTIEIVDSESQKIITTEKFSL